MNPPGVGEDGMCVTAHSKWSITVSGHGDPPPQLTREAQNRPRFTKWVQVGVEDLSPRSLVAVTPGAKGAEVRDKRLVVPGLSRKVEGKE